MKIHGFQHQTTSKIGTLGPFSISCEPVLSSHLKVISAFEEKDKIIMSPTADVIFFRQSE